MSCLFWVSSNTIKYEFTGSEYVGSRLHNFLSITSRYGRKRRVRLFFIINLNNFQNRVYIGHARFTARFSQRPPFYAFARLLHQQPVCFLSVRKSPKKSNAMKCRSRHWSRVRMTQLWSSWELTRIKPEYNFYQVQSVSRILDPHNPRIAGSIALQIYVTYHVRLF